MIVAATGKPDDQPWAPDEAGSRDFALAADAAPVPMWTTKPDGSRGFVNRAYCETMGLPYAEALAVDWRTLIHPDDAARVAAATQAGIAAGGTFGFEARFRAPDGGWRWLRTVTRPRFDSDGGRLGHVGVAHDITEAKTADAAVRAREAQLSALIDQTSAGLAQVDLTGRFTLVNDRFCEIVGRTRDELAHFTMQDITHPADLTANIPLFDAAVRDGTPYAIEKRYIRPDGSMVWVSNSVAVIRRSDGHPYGVLAVTLDITARHSAEAAAAESRARLEFLDRLGKATAEAGDADAVLAVTTRMLGQHLNVDGCIYADVEADGDHFHIRGDWHTPPLQSLLGGMRLSDAPAEAAAALRAGEPWVAPDRLDRVGIDGIRATVCVPHMPGGRLTALMAVHAAAPRQWTAADVALVRDVAERSWAHVQRVRAEAALRDSERQLRLALDGTKIGTWYWDPITRRGGWSERTAQIMGVAHNRPLSQREQAAMIHPDDRARVLEGSARLTAATANDFATEYRIVRPDGGIRWIASHGLIMRDEAGMPIRAIGTIRDITTRREAQQALERLNQRLEAEVTRRTAERDRMWRLSRDLLIVVDLRRRIRAANPAINAIGYDVEGMLGQRMTSFIHPDDLPAANAAMRRVATGPIGEFAARLRTADGSWRHFVWSAAPGEREAYVIGRDVTAETLRREELEQAQEALRQAQKVESLGQLTGGVAHDFNNLLTPIIGNLDLLGRRLGDDPRLSRLVGGALESAERARVLVQRLLAFARRQPLRPGPVSLTALLDGLADLLASTVGPQVRVVTRVAPGLPPAMADANQIELALLNLAVNARDAMPDGGLLTIAALPVANPPDLPAGDYVAISVADTGVGMDPATLARAVEPFFSTKGVGKGTGLGLSMVHGLASQLGGAMRLESRFGVGTRVALVLPIADTAAAVATVGSDAVPAGAGRVLLVDDEVPVRDATAAMLASLGFEVSTAGSGEAALAMLGDVAPDYLVTDHLMPGMRGADLARHARAAHPALKVLVISGYAALDEIPPELPRLAKPFRVDELARRMGALA